MKKLFLILLFLFLILIPCHVNAYSEKFSFLIDTMEIDIQNPNGKYLNEDIYDKYSLFVYGNPLDGYSDQRFKLVENGNCAKGIGIWNGNGERGEYWVLGENNIGTEVHNHKFPVDIEPPTPPTMWRYAIISGAKDSWQDQSKYMDDYQREYMLKSNLMRNDETFNITVMDIGIDKVKLENYATWKTKGSVYTQRYDIQNNRWAANFMIPPMAADAELQGFAEFPNGNTFTLDSTSSVLNIPIKFGAEMINLTDFARPEHVKNIKSELFIDGVLIESIYDEETIKISSQTNYLFSKTLSNEIVELDVTVKSSLLTKFTTDSALVDIKNYKIIIMSSDYEIEPEAIIIDDETNDFIPEETKYNHVRTDKESYSPDFPPPIITKITIKDKDDKELYKAKNTGNKFVLAGQTIIIRVEVLNSPTEVTLHFDGDSSIYTFDSITKQFEWIEPRRRGEKTFFSSIKDFEKMYSKNIRLRKEKNLGDVTVYSTSYIIPYETKQTLHSWSTLRELTSDAFKINENELFTRITYPYEVVVKASNGNGIDTIRTNLDVFERWDTLYNRDLRPYTTN